MATCELYRGTIYTAREKTLYGSMNVENIVTHNIIAI